MMKMNSRIGLLIAAMVLSLSTFAASVSTDRTWYLAGEAMQVNISVDDALIAYAELCDRYSLAASTVVSLNDGKGTGIIELPSDLHSGYYVLSVYTRHQAQVAHQLVAVVNALHKSEDDDIEWVNITHPDSLSYPSFGRANGFSTADLVDVKPFYTYGLHGKQPLVLSAASYTGASLPIEMISPFATLLPKRLPHLVFHYKRSEVEERSLDMQRHQIAIAPAKRELQLGDYADDTAEDGVPLDYDDSLFGTKPDPAYNLDEYRQFLTIREVLLEYVNCVRKTKINGVSQLVVRRPEDAYVSVWPAMVLIDGMPVIDIERLLDYDARRIHYINVYGGQYTFGNGVYNGILSFVTRSGKLTNYPIEPNMQYLVYEFPQ